MKSFIAFILTAFFANPSLAQDQTQSQTPPDSPPQGWYQQQSGTTGTISQLTFINRDTGWAGSLYTTDGGDHWATYQNGKYVLQFIDSLHGWAYSSNGTNWISRTIDGGQTWVDYNTNIGAVSNLFFCTPSKGFFSNGHHIASTSDSGKTWILDTTNVGTIDGFVCWDSINIIAGGGDLRNPHPPYDYPIASVFYSGNGGKSWYFETFAHLANAALIPTLAFGSTTIWFRAGLLGIVKSYNRGSSVIIDGNHTAEAMAASDSNNITLVGPAGTIYRTFDAGKNWVKQSSNTIDDLYGVTFVDSVTGWVVGDGGVILHTTNAGYSWVQQQITIDTLNPQTYPNPANSTVTLGLSLPMPQHITISILDITGNLIQTPVTNQMELSGVLYIPIDVHALPSGIYILNIQTEKYQSSVKITVVH
jgi:photosystem II stability/assembly factor-like uncharacterized protein